MNLPEYSRAMERAFTDFEEAVQEAKGRLQKTLYEAKSEFFEDGETCKAVEVDRR